MRLISEDIACVKDKLYLFANNINLLYSIDVNTRMYEFIGQIPERSIFEKRLVSKIVHWNDELFLIPLVSGDIWIYSFGNKCWRKIKVKQYENNWANSYFRNAFIDEDRLFILGGYYPAVLIIDSNFAHRF